MRHRLFLFLAGLLPLTVVRAAAATFTLNFGGLQNGEQVLNYYDGGLGSLGSGGGPNYGITFTPALEAIAGVPPYGPLEIGWLNGTTATMDVAGGFSGSFSFYYQNSGLVTVWSGLDGTGTMLKSIPLTAATIWTPDGAQLGSTAESVVFSGAGLYLDDITDAGLVVPEPLSLWLVATGAAGLAAGVRRRVLAERKS